MNKKVQFEWEFLKSKLKARWDKLQDTDFEKFRGNLHLIPMRIESIYNISKIQAKQDYSDFITSLEKEVPK